MNSKWTEMKEKLKNWHKIEKKHWKEIEDFLFSSGKIFRVLCGVQSDAKWK